MLAATLYLAYAKAAPTPTITMNINMATDLFCFILVISVLWLVRCRFFALAGLSTI